MKKYIILIGLIGLMLYSCIDDQSEFGTKQISLIRFKTELSKDAYSEDRWNEFSLACPEIEQVGTDKPLTYQWEVNYKVVCQDKDLKYTCDKLSTTEGFDGGFPCRLTVSNEDGASYMDFKLKVTSPYQEGILLMSRQAGQSMFSFRRTDKEGQLFQKDVYRLNNPSVPLGSSPKAMLQYDGRIYIGSENPIKIVRLNSTTLEIENVIKYPTDRIDYMLGNRSGYSSLTFFGAGRVIDFDASQDGIMNMLQQAIDGKYPGIELANKGIRIFDATQNPADLLTYNNTTGMLFHGEYAPEELFAGEFSGKKLVDMVPCKAGQEALLIVQDAKGVISIAYLDPLIPKLHSITPTTGSGIIANSAFLASQKLAVLYYSVGNQIFRYDYSSKGNFPEKSDYQVGNAGDVVHSIVLSQDESQLYIAVNAAEGEFKGCVYCYDNKTMKLLWSEKGVAGEIVQMIYKR